MESHETGWSGPDGGPGSEPEPGPGSGPGPGLPRGCPLSDASAHPLSWELGERVVADCDRVATLSRPGGRTSVAVYDATANTVVVAVRTPAGRKKFFEASASAVERALDREAGGWRRVDDRT